jgi:hypothetical protein
MLEPEFKDQDIAACRVVQALIWATGADHATVAFSKDAPPAVAVKLQFPDGREITRVGKTIYEALEAITAFPSISGG